jgi:kumamolisin
MAEANSGTGQGHVPIPGSERDPLPGATDRGPAASDERVEVTVQVRPRTPAAGALSAEALGAQLPQERQHVSRDQFATTYGADPDELAQVESFARANNLQVAETSAGRRSVILSGTVSAVNAAFGVDLRRYTYQRGTYRGHTGPVRVPAALEGVVEGVFGLDDRPQAQPHFRPFRAVAGPVRPEATPAAFTPVQVAGLYDYPTGSGGKGQCIGIIELGGGYKTEDLTAYFGQLGITPPQVVAVSVDGGANSPTGTPDGPDGEVMLDIEIAGAIAPAATLAVYFAPNTDRGFLDAITTAVHDTTNAPSVISISWGSAESAWTAQALQSFNTAFAAAAQLGVTVCCAAGDNGSSDGVTDGKAHVDFPASSPYVLGCGGTSLKETANAIQSEVVWNNPGHGATGGGVSDTFPLPAWQGGAHVPPSANPGGHVGRGVPDVAGDADPATGYQVRVDGQDVVFGGTSAVAPQWAGLVALLNGRLGKAVGYLNPLLYAKAGGTAAFHDITSGNNGVYDADPGWDACTGWGSPDGTALLKLLSGG